MKINLVCTILQLDRFNPLCTNGFFFLVCYNKLGMVHCGYQGVTGYHFQIILVFFEILSLKIVFSLANSDNRDEMPHYAAFHQGLPCLLKYTFRSHKCTKRQLAIW